MFALRAPVLTLWLCLMLPVAGAHPGTGGLVRAIGEDVNECLEDGACDVEETTDCASEFRCIVSTAVCVDPNDPEQPVKPRCEG